MEIQRVQLGVVVLSDLATYRKYPCLLPVKDVLSVDYPTGK